MNFKEFLKPDWKKIVMFVIIFILLFFIPLYCHDIAVPTAVGVKGFYLPFCTSIYSELSIGYGTITDRIAYTRIPIIISLIISYLISYLIVWIYDKFRKPKKMKR